MHLQPLQCYQQSPRYCLVQTRLHLTLHLLATQPQHAQQRTTCAGTTLNAFHQVIHRSQKKFSILSLIPPIHGRGDKPEDSSLCDAELLLGEALKKLTKVDTSININTTVLPQTGLFVCANTSSAAHSHKFTAPRMLTPSPTPPHSFLPQP